MKSYSIKSLLLLVTLVALIFSWARDHAELKSRIQLLNSFCIESKVISSELSLSGSIDRANKKSKFGIVEFESGCLVETSVQLENLKGCPTWDSNKSPNPPVSASTAIKLADAAIPTLVFPKPGGI